jgi:hypothetical protein
VPDLELGHYVLCLSVWGIEVEYVNHTDAASTGTKMPRTNWGDMAGYTPPTVPVGGA